MKKETIPAAMDRRSFLARGALLGGGAALAAASPGHAAEEGAVLRSKRPDAPYDLSDPENTLNTVCLQCNTGCGIKCKIQDGVLAKIDGNPWNPWTLVPHLDDNISVDHGNEVDGAICPKGQAGLQTAYDPYRLRKVLKRAGKRGENKWQTISFEQAVTEIVEGGNLFSHLPGEENRSVEGLQDILVMRDAALMKTMSADVEAVWSEKTPEGKQAKVAEFKTKYADHLDKMIDPDHPDLGPKNNQLLMFYGRMKGGRGDMLKRFQAAAGTVNRHGHTTVCQGSLYFTCKAMNEQYDLEKGKFSGGKKFYWQGDIENSKFILFVGANLFEANYGPPNRSVRLTDNLVTGFTKIACADPRFSKLAAKSWKWLPLKPGSDSAVAMCIIRWMLDNDRFNQRSVACANQAAIASIGESTWTNATHLVEIKDGQPGAFVRAKSLGLAEGNELVVLVDGQPVAVNPNDTEHAVHGDLYVDTTLPNGVQVKTGLQLLKEESHKHSIEEWCAMADVVPEDVVAVARELTSHGRQVAVDIHRGPAQHTNGFYNVLSWMTINMLLGNFDAKGGMCKATTYDYSGKKGEAMPMTEHPGKLGPFGIDLIRHGIDYEKTTLFKGYPARRNWYPLSSDIYEEIIPSMDDQYPYPIKAVFLYMGAPTYALPAGHTNIPILADLEKTPLFVANDIIVGTSSIYADYIFPDLSYLERWEFQGSHPSFTNQVAPVRQPVIPPVPMTCSVYGEEQPMSFEAMLMGLAEKLDLPGFGDNAFGPGLHLHRPDDYYVRCVANIAHGESKDGSKAVPDANAREIEIFHKSRRHLPKSVFDTDRWQALCGPALWPKVVHVLNRGGRFEEFEKGYKDDQLAHPWAAQLNFYQEKTAGTIHSGTGKPHPGLATYLPIRDYHGNEPDALRKGHDLAMITNRSIVHTKSRTIADPWLSALMPENKLQVHPTDGARLGLKEGQEVKVVSATNPEGEWPLGNGVKKPMIGKVQLTQEVRPGVMSFALGFGHWATGAADILIDDVLIKGEERRAAGVHANAAMWIDPSLKNTCFLDPVGGSVSFYDTHVNLVPV